MKDDNGLHRLVDMNNFWSDDFVSSAGISNEGDVVLKRGKKPEKLLSVLIDLCSNEGDILLDFFLGSGTTAAVAHKKGRQYIGIEQLDYGENDSTVRLDGVICGDQTGISKDEMWKCGGSYVYCELAKQNQIFIDEIETATKESQLKNIYERIMKSGFISYKVNPTSIDESTNEYKALSLEDKKRFLMEILDKNLLYVNYCDMDDDEFEISEEDKAFTRSFYGEE